MSPKLIHLLDSVIKKFKSPKSDEADDVVRQNPLITPQAEQQKILTETERLSKSVLEISKEPVSKKPEESNKP